MAHGSIVHPVDDSCAFEKRNSVSVRCWWMRSSHFSFIYKQRSLRCDCSLVESIVGFLELIFEVLREGLVFYKISKATRGQTLSTTDVDVDLLSRLLIFEESVYTCQLKNICADG